MSSEKKQAAWLSTEWYAERLEENPQVAINEARGGVWRTIDSGLVKGAAQRLRELHTQLQEKDAEIERLRDEFEPMQEAAWHFAILLAHELMGESDNDGWMTTNCTTDACQVGDWLVANAGWERKDDGVGRAQKYRCPPIDLPTQQQQEAE